jgi:hypothetical protein
MTRLLRIEHCADCPFCDGFRVQGAGYWYDCIHPGAPTQPYTLSRDDDGIDVTSEVDEGACPLEVAP